MFDGAGINPAIFGHHGHGYNPTMDMSGIRDSGAGGYPGRGMMSPTGLGMGFLRWSGQHRGAPPIPNWVVENDLRRRGILPPLPVSPYRRARMPLTYHRRWIPRREFMRRLRSRGNRRRRY